MTTRTTVLAVLGTALVGAIVLWAFFGEEPEQPVALESDRTVQLDADDLRRIRRPPLASMRFQAKDIRSALAYKRDEVAECAKLVRVHEGRDIEQVQLSVTYTSREDGRYDVDVLAPELGEVTFDRCLNTVLESMTVADDALGTFELDLLPED
ncbi:MAG: hypothetical protein AAF211_02545 [Myxococcota bacterium]